jgi:crcB protein
MYYLFIAIFGALGAIGRYWLGLTIGAGALPYNTLVINIIGCFLLAVVIRYLASFQNLSRHLISGLGTGLIGSFTTFSTFSVENARLITSGNYLTAVIYILLSIVGGFLSAGLGFYMSDMLIERREQRENAD